MSDPTRTTASIRKIGDLRRSRETLLRATGREIAELKPLGVMSEVSMVMGAFLPPGSGKVAVYIPPYGHVIFAKNKSPTRDQIEVWQSRYAKVEKLLEEEARITSGTIPTLAEMENKTIGNRLAHQRHVQHAKEFGASREQRAYIRALADHWDKHPAALSGVVRMGKVVPIFKNSTYAARAAKNRWYQKIVEARRSWPHTGWRKDDPPDVRRRVLLAYQRGHRKREAEAVLASARWARALANVHQDPVTRQRLIADANFFFRGYRKMVA